MSATARIAKRTASREMGTMTLGDAAGDAGLSQGIVNLRFKSKDNLLKETLRHHAAHVHILESETRRFA